MWMVKCLFMKGFLDRQHLKAGDWAFDKRLGPPPGALCKQ
jgi:hypothetical protein